MKLHQAVADYRDISLLEAGGPGSGRKAGVYGPSSETDPAKIASEHHKALMQNGFKHTGTSTNYSADSTESRYQHSDGRQVLIHSKPTGKTKLSWIAFSPGKTASTGITSGELDENLSSTKGKLAARGKR